MGAPHRRTIYIASLEAHIDRLHNQLLGIGLYPIPFQRLEPYRGLNSKTAKVTIQFLFPSETVDFIFIKEHGGGLAARCYPHKAQVARARTFGTSFVHSPPNPHIKRFLPQNNNLHKLLGTQAISTSSISLEADVRRHSMDSVVHPRAAISPIIMDSLAYSARS
jgi:hypothetical protein